MITETSGSWSAAKLLSGIEQNITVFGAGLLSILLALSASDQIRHFQGFVEALRSYAVVPQGPEREIAVLIIGAEILIAALVLMPKLRRTAAVAAAALLGLFTVTVAVNLAFTPNSTCGSWYTLTLGRGTLANVAQNILFTGLALVIPGSSARKTQSENVN